MKIYTVARILEELLEEPWEFSSPADYGDYDKEVERTRIKTSAKAVMLDLKEICMGAFNVSREEDQFLKNDQFITAIKSYRERVNCTLKHAKEVMDRRRDELFNPGRHVEEEKTNE